jgi:hypothetical protein
MKSEEQPGLMFCPHCRKQTRAVPVKHKAGPAGVEVLILGVFAFLQSGRSQSGFVCEHCNTVFGLTSPSTGHGRLSGVFLLLFILVATALVVAFIVYRSE